MNEDEIPRGYVKHQLSHSRLFLPVQLSASLKAEFDESEALRVLHARNREAAKALELITEESEELEPMPEPVSSVTPGMRTIYKLRELEALTNRAKSFKDGDESARVLRIVKKLVNLGFTRKYQTPDPAVVAAMATEFPHFGDVIALVHRHLVLAHKARTAPLIPPILLHGGPGLGKTHFTRELARVLGAPSRTVQFDTGAENSALLGLDKQWSNSKPGILFELLCLGPVCNPTVLLEELDKTHKFSESCPLDALHALLEPSTAVSVRDMCLELQFDAGAVTYIATANDLSKIPEPLQSRFEIFDVQQPTPEQSIQIAQTVAAAVVKEYAGFNPVSRAVAVAVAHLTARGVRKAVTSAIANAVLNDRDYLKASDMRLEDIDGSASSLLH
ncbi:MAG: AAA family ATPase [Pseudomonadota bacterium]